MSGIDTLNSDCFCFSLDRDALGARARCRARHAGPGGADARALPDAVRRAAGVRGAPHTCSAWRRWCARSSRWWRCRPTASGAGRRAGHRAPAGAGGPRGVFFGYDFHLDQGRLGADRDQHQRRRRAAQRGAGARAARLLRGDGRDGAHARRRGARSSSGFVAMFRRRMAPRAAHAHRCAASPSSTSARRRSTCTPSSCSSSELFERAGLRAVIVDPRRAAVARRRAVARRPGHRPGLQPAHRLLPRAPASAALREAYCRRRVVLTPHPHAHALYADKRHLALLSDAARLRRWASPKPTRQVLLRPRAAHRGGRRRPTPSACGRRAAACSSSRSAGFGSHAAYRGDKLTRARWQEILAGDYVAQAIVPPSERHDRSTTTARRP